MLYMYFRSYRDGNIKGTSYTIEHLKNLLGLEDKYDRWADFKRYILLPAIEEINETETEIIFKLIDNKGFIPVSLEYIDKPYEPSKTDATFIDIVFSDIRLYEFIREESIQRT